MGWFQRTAAPVRPGLARAFVGAPAGEWPRAYEAQVSDAVIANPVAQRALRLVTDGVAGVPVYAADEAQADAAALVAPVLEPAAAHLLLHGNAFLHIGLDAAGRPAELVALRPERVTIETDANGWPAAYLYRAGQAVTRFPAADGAGRPGVIHLAQVHPLDDHYGLGCLTAAAGAVAVHNAAQRWNKALLDNAARPSGALVHEPGEGGAALSPDQFDRLKREMEESFAGQANAGRPMLLEGGLRWQAMSLTPADMDFAGLKAGAARDIALAFGVPPMLLGLPGDATYANYTEANRALFRLTVLPMAQRIADGAGRALAAWWPGCRLLPDPDGVPALAADRERLWRQVAAADFLSRGEKRAMLGFAGDGA